MPLPLTIGTGRAILGGSGRSEPPYALNDQFVTDRAAGAIDGTNAEPIGGARTVGDANSKLTISGGELVMAVVAAGTMTATLRYGSFARAPGMALLWRQRGTGLIPAVGWSTSTTLSDANLAHGAAIAPNITAGDNVNWRGQGAQAITGSGHGNHTKTEFALVLQSTGCLVIWNGRLAWYDIALTTTPLYPVIGQVSTTAQGRFDKFRQIDLGLLDAVWDTNFGKATIQQASPSAGQAYAGTADALINWRMTAATGVTQEVKVRYVDDNNCIIIRFSESGDTCKIIDVTSGSETELASGAMTQNNGSNYNLTIRLDRTAIKVYNGVSIVASYNKALTHITETSLKLSHAGANLFSWPLDIGLPSSVTHTARLILCVGDSKTYGVGDTVTPPPSDSSGYPPKLIDSLSGTWAELQPRRGVSGQTVNYFYTNMDAFLRDYLAHPDYICVNLGVNDITGGSPGSLPTEATWKSQYGYVLDALHDRFPNAIIGVARIWKRNYAANCATMNTWIGTLVSARAFCVLGPDESVYLENGDNGVTYTDNGLEPNTLGHAATAAQWKLAFTL